MVMRWPKQCGCGRSYTKEQWNSLPPKGEPVDYGGGYVLEMKDCECANTMAVNVAEVQPCASDR